MASITTVQGDIAAERLGFCQPHEHVYIVDTIALATHPELRINNFPASVEELRLYGKAGGASVVDAQPLGAGRDALALREASRLSGVNIVASTGYHLPFFYPEGHWIFTAGEEKLAALFLEELEGGMYLGGSYAWPTERTGVRAGVIKAMITDNGVRGREEVLLRAAGRAAASAGVSVLLHTERGKYALDAIRILGDAGLPPERVLVCHLDRQATDFAIHEDVAATGAYLEYDTVTMFEHHNNAEEILLLDHMAKAGHLERLLLSTDPTVDRLKSYGSLVGMDYLLTSFLPLLRAFGFTEEMIHALCVANPGRALARR